MALSLAMVSYVSFHLTRRFAVFYQFAILPEKKFISTSLLFNSRFILKSEQLTHNFYICSMLLVSNTVSLAEIGTMRAMRCFTDIKVRFRLNALLKNDTICISGCNMFWDLR